MAKIFAGITVGYLLSPIDLIPDFIPVVGLLDDLILVPILIKVTFSQIPSEVLNDLREKYSNQKLTKKWYFAIPFIIFYLMIVAAEAFYKAFDVKEGDKLYKKPEERIRIW